MQSTEVNSLTKSDRSALQNRYPETKNQFIEPHLKEFEDISGNNLTLWAIFKKDEYYITFDEKNRKFGLAFKNIFNELIYLGDYGKLMDAYEDLVSRNE